MTTCYKHNYEYGYGNCPLCEQERHHGVMEEEAKRQTKELERQRSDASEQQEREEQRRLDERYEQEEKEENERRRKAKRALTQLVNEIFEKYGGEFFANYYLRIAGAAAEYTSDDHIGELIRDGIARKLDAESNSLIAEQVLLINFLTTEKENARRSVSNAMYKLLSFTGSGISRSRSVFSALGLGIGLLVAWITITDISIFRWVSYLFYCTVGVAGGYFIGEKLANKYRRQYRYVESKINQYLKEFNGGIKWYDSEVSLGENLFASSGKGHLVFDALMEDWLKADRSSLGKDVAKELNNCKKLKLKLDEQLSNEISSLGSSSSSLSRPTGPAFSSVGKKIILGLISLPFIFLAGGFVYVKLTRLSSNHYESVAGKVKVSDWNLIVNGDNLGGGAIYLLPSSVKANGRVINATVLVDYKVAQNSNDGEVFKSKITVISFKCGEALYEIKKQSSHSLNMGEGDVNWAFESNENSVYGSIDNDRVRATYKYLCSIDGNVAAPPEPTSAPEPTATHTTASSS